MGRGKTYDDPVVRSHNPAWGSVQIARAMRDCLVTASKIGTNNNNTNSNSRTPPAEQQKQQGRAKETAAGAGGASEAKKKPGEVDPRFDPNRFVISKPSCLVTASNDNGDDVKMIIPPVDKFIFISETCLPVRTLSECREVLFPPPLAAEAAAAAETAAVDQDDSAKDGDEKDAAGEKDTATTTSSTTTTTTERVDPWDVSWLNARNRNMEGTPRNLYERDQFGKIHRMVPGMCRWKADQWIMLSRKHALAVLHIDSHMPPKDELWNAFADINASDEMYFPTALGVLGILQEDDGDNSNKNGATAAVAAPPRSEAYASIDSRRDSDGRDVVDEREPRQNPNPNEVVKRPVTYTDWSEGMRNPTSFSGVREFTKVATAARQQGSLMARKFVVAADGQSISVDEWTGVMEKMIATEREKKDQ